MLSTVQGRRRAVTFALRLTDNTPLAPLPLEQQLLEQFVQGELSLDQVLEKLERTDAAGPI